MDYETKVDVGNVPEGLSTGDGAEVPKRSHGLLIAAIIAAIVLAIAVLAIFLSGDAPVSTESDAGTAPVVTVISPGASTVEGMFNVTGTVAARREMPVGVVGEGGLVVSVPVEQGDWVKAGQTLVVIDRSVQNRQVESQAAQIEISQADANLAQANLDRSLKLVERGFISKADIDRLTATRDASVARVRLAQAQLKELRARNARLNIVAPAAGLVLERSVEPGQVAGAGSGTLFLIARGGQMEVQANVSEAELAQLSVGEMAVVTPVGTDKSFSGEIWQLAPTIDAMDRQGMARISVPYSPELRPGGFASVQINSGTTVAPLLPESAILSDIDGSYVIVIDDENKAVRFPVEVGMVSEAGIAITSGLDGTEQIVERAGAFLTLGETVRPVSAEVGS